MVKVENVNCIAVEWKKGVKTQYAVAANNVRVVAAQVASMITFLMVILKLSKITGKWIANLSLQTNQTAQIPLMFNI